MSFEERVKLLQQINQYTPRRRPSQHNKNNTEQNKRPGAMKAGRPKGAKNKNCTGKPPLKDLLNETPLHTSSN